MQGLGFIGFGEAAYFIAQGLKEEGLTKQYAYDVNVKDPTFGQQIKRRAGEAAIILVDSLEDLTRHCHVIICATSAKAVVPIAKSINQHLIDEHIYVDINAASAEVKKQAAIYIQKSSAQFVDGAVMGSIPVNKHKTPIYLSGLGAEKFRQFGERYDMKFTYISDTAGDASAIKMFRSIFMKGLATLLWETLESSFKYGVEDYVVHSLNESISGQSLSDLANALLPRTAIHAKRRVFEMEEVIQSIQAIDVDATLSRAIKGKLSSIAEDDRHKQFQKAPNSYIQLFESVLSQRKGVT